MDDGEDDEKAMPVYSADRGNVNNFPEFLMVRTVVENDRFKKVQKQLVLLKGYEKVIAATDRRVLATWQLSSIAMRLCFS